MATRRNNIMKNQHQNKIVLDLCGGTGSWAKPYKDAGYAVLTITWPQFDVTRTSIGGGSLIFCDPNGKPILQVDKEKVYGILAAPPCTHFSMARTRAKTPRDLKKAMDCVNACIEIIQSCQHNGKRLAFWALENPKARLRWFLGRPPFTFNPYDFGDRHRKPTDIWGNFADPVKNPVTLTGPELERMGNNSRRLPILEGMAKGDRQARRSITPQGFAMAFFKANR